MPKLIKLKKSETVGVGRIPHIALSRDDFPAKIDAGMIDKFIEVNFPQTISRKLNQVNGVSVTPQEIVITLDKPLPEIQIDKIITALEQNQWNT